MVYNSSKKDKILKKGFTIIEVALFLAISAAMFASVMYGIATSVARRRYNDSVSGIVEELKNAYSAAINVENYRRGEDKSSFFCSITSAFSGGNLVINSSTNDTKIETDNNPGRTRCAYYGQVITFGEDSDSRIHRYDLIGLALEDNIEPEDSDDVIASIRDFAKANIVTIKNTDVSAVTCTVATAGTSSSYLPSWEARIENKGNRNLYHGAIMITRSPISGTIHTYLYSANGNATDSDGSIKDNSDDDSAFAVQDWLISNAGNKNCNGFNSSHNGYFVHKAIKEGKMIKDHYLEFCVGSDDLYAVGNKRRAIRIHGDGSNEASVELLPESESVVACGV